MLSLPSYLPEPYTTPSSRSSASWYTPSTIITGLTPDDFSVAQQIEELRMLQRYLELSGIQCESSVMIEDITIPLLVKMSRQTVAIGAYPVQQDHQVIKHPLTALSRNQMYRLFNDYDLAHDLPRIAHDLLLFL